MDGVLKIAKAQRGILARRIRMLSTGVMITTEMVRGHPVDTTAKTLAESQVLLESFENLIARHEHQNAVRA